MMLSAERPIKQVVDMLAIGGSIYEVTGTAERSEAIGGTLEQ